MASFPSQENAATRPQPVSRKSLPPAADPIEASQKTVGKKDGPHLLFSEGDLASDAEALSDPLRESPAAQDHGGWVLLQLCGLGARIGPIVRFEVGVALLAILVAIIATIVKHTCIEGQSNTPCSFWGANVGSWMLLVAYSMAISIPGRILDALFFTVVGFLGETASLPRALSFLDLNTFFYWLLSFQGAIARFFWISLTWLNAEGYVQTTNPGVVANIFQTLLAVQIFTVARNLGLRLMLRNVMVGSFMDSVSNVLFEQLVLLSLTKPHPEVLSDGRVRLQKDSAYRELYRVVLANDVQRKLDFVSRLRFRVYSEDGRLVPVAQKNYLLPFAKSAFYRLVSLPEESIVLHKISEDKIQEADIDFLKQQQQQQQQLEGGIGLLGAAAGGGVPTATMGAFVSSPAPAFTTVNPLSGAGVMGQTAAAAAPSGNQSAAIGATMGSAGAATVGTTNSDDDDDDHNDFGQDDDDSDERGGSTSKTTPTPIAPVTPGSGGPSGSNNSNNTAARPAWRARASTAFQVLAERVAVFRDDLDSEAGGLSKDAAALLIAANTSANAAISTASSTSNATIRSGPSGILTTKSSQHWRGGTATAPAQSGGAGSGQDGARGRAPSILGIFGVSAGVGGGGIGGPTSSPSLGGIKGPSSEKDDSRLLAAPPPPPPGLVLGGSAATDSSSVAISIRPQHHQQHQHQHQQQFAADLAALRDDEASIAARLNQRLMMGLSGNSSSAAAAAVVPVPAPAPAPAPAPVSVPLPPIRVPFAPSAAASASNASSSGSNHGRRLTSMTFVNPNAPAPVPQPSAQANAQAAPVPQSISQPQQQPRGTSAPTLTRNPSMRRRRSASADGIAEGLDSIDSSNEAVEAEVLSALDSRAFGGFGSGSSARGGGSHHSPQLPPRVTFKSGGASADDSIVASSTAGGTKRNSWLFNRSWRRSGGGAAPTTTDGASSFSSSSSSGGGGGMKQSSSASALDKLAASSSGSEAMIMASNGKTVGSSASGSRSPLSSAHSSHHQASHHGHGHGQGQGHAAAADHYLNSSHLNFASVGRLMGSVVSQIVKSAMTFEDEGRTELGLGGSGAGEDEEDGLESPRRTSGSLSRAASSDGSSGPVTGTSSSSSASASALAGAPSAPPGFVAGGSTSSVGRRTPHGFTGVSRNSSPVPSAHGTLTRAAASFYAAEAKKMATGTTAADPSIVGQSDVVASNDGTNSNIDNNWHLPPAERHALAQQQQQLLQQQQLQGQKHHHHRHHPPLTINHFATVLDSRHVDIEKAFALFESDPTRPVDKQTFVSKLAGIYDNLRQLKASLNGSTSVSTALNLLLDGLFWTATLLATLLIWEVNLTAVFVPLGTVLVSASFAIGSTLSNIVSSLIFVLVTKPFSVGDRVTASGVFNGDETLIVRRIDVLSTEFARLTNKVILVPNSELSKMVIENHRRSPPAVLRIDLNVSVNTTAAQLEAFRVALNSYLKTQRAAWKSDCMIRMSAIKEQSVCLAVWLNSNYSWQAAPTLWREIFRMYLSAFLPALRATGIQFRAADQRVQLDGKLKVEGGGGASSLPLPVPVASIGSSVPLPNAAALMQSAAAASAGFSTSGGNGTPFVLSGANTAVNTVNGGASSPGGGNNQGGFRMNAPTAPAAPAALPAAASDASGGMIQAQQQTMLAMQQQQQQLLTMVMAMMAQQHQQQQAAMTTRPVALPVPAPAPAVAPQFATAPFVFSMPVTALAAAAPPAPPPAGGSSAAALSSSSSSSELRRLAAFQRSNSVGAGLSNGAASGSGSGSFSS